MYLKTGDTIGIIALSGDCDKVKIEKAKTYFESLGYKVKLSKNIYEQNRYLAGNDNDKVSELENFFQDPEVKLILNARGGYGAIRLINKINYKILELNPKPICGFSDTTALLNMIYKKTGLITYHSPMASSDFGDGLGVSEFTEDNFFKAINSQEMSFVGEKVYTDGFAKGILFGGNLSTIVSLCGLDFIPDNNFIFFTEDINEPCYKIDKMFQQLFNIEKFTKNCKGIILGEFSNIDNKNWLNQYFSELEFCIPIIGGFKISHERDKITIPIGKIGIIENSTLFIPKDYKYDY